MRAVHLSDLHVAACALRCLPEEQQPDAVRQAVEHANIADRYRKRLRKAHLVFGSGTLSSAFGPVDVPERCDTAYLQALRTVVAILLQRADKK